MARGYKVGPFGALKTREAGGVAVVALTACRSCGEKLPVRIDGKGWPFRVCPIKTGCGFKEQAFNAAGALFVFSDVQQWAFPENESEAQSLAASIDLYPVKSRAKSWDDTPPPISPAPVIAEAVESASEPPKIQSEKPKKKKNKKNKKEKQAVIDTADHDEDAL